MVVHNAISSHEAVARFSQLYAHWVAEFARLRRERVSDVAKLAVEYCDVFLTVSESTELSTLMRQCLSCYALFLTLWCRRGAHDP